MSATVLCHLETRESLEMSVTCILLSRPIDHFYLFFKSIRIIDIILDT